jgi:hypothetical protein
VGNDSTTQTFLNFALDGSDWSDSRLARLTPWEIAPGTVWLGCRVVPTAGPYSKWYSLNFKCTVFEKRDQMPKLDNEHGSCKIKNLCSVGYVTRCSPEILQ